MTGCRPADDAISKTPHALQLFFDSLPAQMFSVTNVEAKIFQKRSNTESNFTSDMHRLGARVNVSLQS